MRVIACLVVAVALVGCRTPGERAARFESIACTANVASCIRRVFDMHGGLERFRAFRYARYELGDTWRFPFSVVKPWPSEVEALRVTADRTGDRLAIALSGSGLRGGVDGRGPWTTGALDETSLWDARELSFVLALPFPMAGGRVLDVDVDRFHDRNVLALDVAMPSGGEWRVYVSPLTMGLVGASAWDSRRKVRSDYFVESWQVVEGLLVPRRVSVDVYPGHLAVRDVDVRRVELLRALPDAWSDAPGEARRWGQH